jgi:glutaconyl-CoA/methylmalonyl-CoA decarboxylase subunit delta
MTTVFLDSISEGLFISFFSIVIVFVILGVIALSIHYMQYLYKKPIIIPEIKKLYQKPFELLDIKDDDMLVAGLIASIDYFEETKENVRILSIKEI